MPRVVAKVGALVFWGFICACGSKFQAGDASGGAGGNGGTSSGGSSAGSGKGGSTSGGSTSGGSSSGGSSSGAGGSGACVPGGACAPEGSSCTDGDCCPCLYECHSGKWQMTACAGCAAPSCPPEPPSDGQACGNCQDPVGVPCSWELCDASLGRYSATCDGATWSLSVEPCGGDGCCDGDDQCESRICVNNVCKESVADGCWRDADCGLDAICSGAFVCECNVACLVPDTPGTCVPDNLDCCTDESMCVAGQECVAGVCKEPPPQGSCWSDRDCPGGVCMDAQLCRCGETCTGIEYPGTCI